MTSDKYILNLNDTGDKVEFNTVDFVESRLLPKLATNRQQSRCCRILSTLLLIRLTFLPVLTTNRQQREFDSLSRSTLLPIRSTLSPVCTRLKALRHGSHNFTCKHHICLYLVSVHQTAPPLIVVTESNCSLLLIYRPEAIL